MTNFILKTLESVENRFATLEDMNEWQLPCGCAQPGQRLECINCPHLKEKIAAVQESLKPQIGSDLPTPDTELLTENDIRKRRDAELAAKVLALHEKGESTRSIAKEIGNVSSSKVGRIISSAGKEPIQIEFRKYSLEIKQQCLELYQEGISTGKISKQTGVPTYIITYWANEEGLTQNSAHYAAMKKVALALFSEGKSIEEIATLTNVKKATLHKWLVKAKVKQPKQNHPPEVKSKALELYLQGVPNTQIAKELGVNRTTISRWVGKSGIQYRKQKVYSQADQQKCLELYEELQTYQAVAEIMDISLATVRRWVLSNEPDKPVKSYHSNELRETCLELCREQEPSAVAEKMGIPVQTIYTWQRKERIAQKAASYPKSQQQFCLFLWSEQSKSAIEIQAELGIELDVIKYWICYAKDCRSRGYSPEIRRQCLDLYQKDYSLTKIEELMGVSICTIRNWVKFEGLAQRGHHFSKAEKQVLLEKCVEYRQAEKTYEEIFELVGISSRTVFQWLKEIAQD